MKLKSVDSKEQDKYRPKQNIIFVILGLILLIIWYFTTKVYRANIPSEYLDLEIIKETKIQWNYYYNYNIRNNQNLWKDLDSEISRINEVKSVYLDPEEVWDSQDVLPYLQPKINANSWEYDIIILKKDLDEVKVKQVDIKTDKFNPSFIFYFPLDYDEVKMNKELKKLVYKISQFLTSQKKEDKDQVSVELDLHSDYLLTFTLMFEEPPVNFDMKRLEEMNQIIQDKFQIYKTLFSPHINFKLSTQVQYYAPLSFVPKYEDGTYTLLSEQLPYFINSAEWDLTSTTSILPEINFINYISKYDNLTIDKQFNSFLIPKWGSIYLLNDFIDLNHSVDVHLNHFFKLIGLDVMKYGNIIAIHQFYLNYIQFNLNNIKTTLKSLKELIDNIQHMKVQDKIIIQIHQVIKDYKLSIKNFNLNNVDKSLLYSIRANALMEKTFFDQNLMSQLYFPIDNSYALFLPLLLPVVMVLPISLFKKYFKLFKSKSIKKE